MIESFRTWGSDFPESIQRWQAARARPILHFTTAGSGDGHEIITPRAIAQGYGDEYLLRLNKLFWAKKMRAYVSPLGEPNRCLNVYASYDCEGPPATPPTARPGTGAPSGASTSSSTAAASGARSTRRLADAGLRPLQPDVARAAAGAGRRDLEHTARRLPDGAPEPAPPLLPRETDYVDWVGTDFYSDNQDWKSLDGPLQPLLARSRSRSPSSASPTATTRATSST